MLYHINGDLLESDCTVIMHQANCFSTMGAGIAKQIANKYPQVEEHDRLFELSPEERLGKFSAIIIDGKTIVNLYGQYRYGRGKQTDYSALESAINFFLTYAPEEETVDLTKIGVPFNMGCGLAGGDWNKVLEILERQSMIHGVDIYIYKL